MHSEVGSFEVGMLNSVADSYSCIVIKSPVVATEGSLLFGEMKGTCCIVIMDRPTV